MIDKFIEKQFESFNTNRYSFHKVDKVSSLEAQAAELIKKITDLNKDLGFEVDDLIGGMVRAYGNVYFQEGFKQGLILAKEMHQLSLKED
ncbi:MAG: hypothetical protein LLF98_12620 [Clostridium sp.]|uniref:hypothetical protein n=1 Tax=Clostridium sp. TaxID=1506 RepID=UPI0025C587B2|nr:hypothetical protein [Clostridium sp.]MCE5222062.1 hypothetical protein [Clostridium sp.]